MEPDLTLDDVSSFGNLIVFFNLDLAGPSFIKQLQGDGIKGKGEVIDPFDTNNWRMLYDDEEEGRSIDLNQYFSFSVERGSEDSAAIEKLGFIAIVEDISEDEFHISLEFENPTEVSSGTAKD